MPETKLSSTGSAGGLVRSAGGLAAGRFRSTRPWPVFGARHESGLPRIRLDIPNHRSKFLVSSNPPVKILTLPEGLPFPDCDSVGAHGGSGLQPSPNLGQVLMRLQNNVYVIRHDHPREQIVTVPDAFAKKKCLHKRVTNVRVRQPSR